MNPAWGPSFFYEGPRFLQFSIFTIYTNIYENFAISGTVVLENKNFKHFSYVFQ